MFNLYDNFVVNDSNKQPYSFSVERHTETANLHAWVLDNQFHLSSVGNRHILNVPSFRTCEFKMNFRINYLAEFSPNFMILFQYDEASRCGKAVRFTYDLKVGITIALVNVNRNGIQIEKTIEKEFSTPLNEETLTMLGLTIEMDRIHGMIGDVEFSFDCESKMGKLAIERQNFIGELIIDSVSFKTNDEFAEETIIPEARVEIPCVNGGDIPYTISWIMKKIEDDYYLTATFGGGTKTRKVMREDRPGQYVAEKDWMTSPYIGFCTSEEERYTYCILNGEKCFIDPNIFWDCQKKFFLDTDIPVSVTYKLPRSIARDVSEILFGYENLKCSGYGAESGSAEFRFTPDGKLLGYGEPMDGRDIFEIKSQKDKYALALIPDDCYKRDEVVEHIENNHYFDVSEDILFVMDMYTKTTSDYLCVKAEIQDVYETKTLLPLNTKGVTSKDRYGYTRISTTVSAPPMEVGVYKIVFSVYYGEKLYKTKQAAFEIFNKDTNENPAIKSGLPYVFSMPNEQKWLMRNSFDLWSKAKSCNLEHYITCITDTPHEAEERKSWVLSKAFKREWFAWLGSRVCRRGEWGNEQHLDVVKNADYLFRSFDEKMVDLGATCLYPLRRDSYVYIDKYHPRYEEYLTVLHGFLRDNPQLANKLEYKPDMEEFTYKHYVDLMRTCMAEWIQYHEESAGERIKKQNEELAVINPTIRRSIYGPAPAYFSPTLTYHSVNVYGQLSGMRMKNDAFTGFAVFEDYPFSCSYQTYRGAFAVSTILLKSPELVIYPEQYTGSKGGCIDGAVKFAHAPMGVYSVEAYQNSTHSFEFVFNTAYRLSDGYHYWNTYGFHRPNYAPEFMEKLVLDWRYALDNKPVKPLKAIAYLTEYSTDDDKLDIIWDGTNNGRCYINNRSESGHTIIYECSRESGLPHGFVMDYEALKTLSAEECDVLVLPSLKGADAECINKIRQLHKDGVKLIAVSDVTGVEDLFGVKPDAKEVKLNCIQYKGESEFVKEHIAEVTYSQAGAKVIVKGNEDVPLVMVTESTAIINTDVINLGCDDSLSVNVSKMNFIVGKTVRQVMKDILSDLSNPIAKAEENIGVTLFEKENGKTELMLIDYTPFDNVQNVEKEITVTINLPMITNATSDKELFVGKTNGEIREIKVSIKPYETIFIELE